MKKLKINKKDSFWKKIDLIFYGILFLLAGLISYVESIVSGKMAMNYIGENILPHSILGIVLGIFLIILGIIKLIKKIK